MIPSSVAGSSGASAAADRRPFYSAADFDAIVKAHQAAVFSIAYHALHDRAQAEELAQDVFLQLHRRLADIESPEHLVFWLRKTACHRAIDLLRKRKRSPELRWETLPERADAPRISDPLLGATLRRLIASLPGQQRMMVILRYQEDLDPAEIASLLEMPVNTVKSTLHRALVLLREKLGRSGETLP